MKQVAEDTAHTLIQTDSDGPNTSCVSGNFRDQEFRFFQYYVESERWEFAWC